MKLGFSLLCLLFLNACISQTTPSVTWQTTAQRYFAIYAERQDFSTFMQFYAKDVQFEDMVYGHRASGIEALAKFFDWSAGNFVVVGKGPALHIVELLYDEESHTAVARGVFREFEFKGRKMGPWRFTTVLKFNEHGKITYQQDWINYTPKKDFMTGQNLNR
ncbi:nuclear transport factor 2 family protein [Pseudoalteromonas sp. T1lg65]|uniref:nuclear transport factor 2 family protein n=1 Tax=Pseudoalteromonas sp. T1lg65 TaxID=2077101 RepID=UPI003F7A87F4